MAGWGSTGRRWDGTRGGNMPARALRPLVRMALCIRSQRGAAADEAAGPGIVDPLLESMDMEQLAGFVAGLDAVVAIDTMVAHLAGGDGAGTVRELCVSDRFQNGCRPMGQYQKPRPD